MPHLMNYLKENNIQIDQQTFEASCFLAIQLPIPDSERILAGIEQFENTTVNFIGTH